jgi:prepilin-type N-terminal cleavage/methylation domain-containing protein
MHKQKGFTLIELLVVITIIGLLAAIALPNYIKAKDKAKEAEVKANVRTIEIALERYATDNDGSYPRYIWGGDELGWDYYFNNDFVGSVDDNGTESAIYDPLVLYNYVESYPRTRSYAMERVSFTKRRHLTEISARATPGSDTPVL